MYRGFESPLVHRAPGAITGEPGSVGDRTGLLWRYHVDDIGLDRVTEGRVHGHVRGIHAFYGATPGFTDPLDHPRIQGLPALLEQRLLGKLVLRIIDQDLGFGLVLLQVMSDQADPLVRPRRATERVARRRDDDNPAVGHGL